MVVIRLISFHHFIITSSMIYFNLWGFTKGIEREMNYVLDISIIISIFFNSFQPIQCRTVEPPINIHLLSAIKLR